MCLLQFRFEHYRSLSMLKVPADVELSSRPLSRTGLPFQFQPSLLSPAQTSTVRVLHAFIHNFPKSEGFALSELTSEINLDLASCGEPSRLKERMVGEVLASPG